MTDWVKETPNYIYLLLVFQDVDSSAIIWGVGSNSLQLPIPSTCPDGFKLLMMQCWSAKTKNRPSFRQILMHIDIAAVDFLSTPQEAYFDKQVREPLIHSG